MIYVIQNRRTLHRRIESRINTQLQLHATSVATEVLPTVGFEGDRIYRILKPDGRIARAAPVHIVERLLWDRMSSKKEKDFITDPTKPGVLVNRMPISKSLSDLRTAVKRKANRDKVWLEDLGYY
jgi:hypothetical protein